MSRQSLALLAFATVLLAAIGCDDPASPTGSSSGRSLLIQSPDRTLEPERANRVELQLTASGTFLPGMPITIRARASARRSARTLDLDLDQLDVKGSSDPLFRHRGPSLTVGGSRDLTATITYANPGYYRVVAHALALPMDPGFEPDTIFSEGAQETIYLRIGPVDGGVSTTFDRSIGQREILAYGSFGERLGQRDSTALLRVARRSMSLRAARRDSSLKVLGSNFVDGYIKYHDPGVSSPFYSPVPGGRVSGRCAGISENALWYDMFVDELTYVGPDGYFFIQCPDGYDRFEGVFTFWGANSYVTGPNGLFSGIDFVVSTGTTNEFHAPTNASMTFRRLETFAPQFFAKFGRSRTRVNVWVWESSGLSNSSYCFASSSSCPGSDVIRIAHNQVNFETGLFTLMHEYGHAYHFGGLRAPANNDCPSPHSLNQPSSRSCAFVEGFADFAGAWIAGDSLVNSSVADFYFEAGAFSGSGQNGSVIEGAVAAFLYDLVDGNTDKNSFSNTAGTTDDSVVYAGGFVADIISSCQTSQFGVPTAPAPQNGIDGIDQFVACAERSTSVESLYNPSTGARYLGLRFDALTVTGSLPTGYSAAAIRSSWIYDLFKQGALP